jgi:hypothetical protein
MEKRKKQTRIARIITGHRSPSSPLEHFHQYCSPAVGKDEGAVFLGFGFVLAQSQAAAGMLLGQSLAKTPKILAPHGYSISSNALLDQRPISTRRMLLIRSDCAENVVIYYCRG